MENKSSLKVRVQKLGTALSNMVMPNIGAFIAWGIMATLFIDTGWIPNPTLNVMVSPILTYLLPLLIGYTAGYNVYGQRGAVVGAIATFGAIAGSSVTMFIGAMVMGPLGAWCIKKFDERFQEKIRPGFEMLVNNFSAGIIGFILIILAFLAVGPVVSSLTDAIGVGVHYEKDLEPFIERKLFSVNSGHATSAYTGAFYGAKTILEALKDDRVKAQVEAVLGEIRSLLITKWNFDEQALIDYHKIIISRFENPFIVDDVNRVARTPIRKLGYDERFIRPIRELKERQLSYQNLLKTIAFVFNYNDSNDEQSVQLQELLVTKPLPEVVADVTGLTDQDLISEIVDSIENL